MKKLYFYLIGTLIFVLTSGGAYVAGRYATEKMYIQAIAEQALIDINRSLNLLTLMGESIPSEVRSEIDLNIQRHLTSVMRYIENDESSIDAYKARVLSRLAIAWSKHPPFQSQEMIVASQKNPDVESLNRKSIEFVMNFQAKNGLR